MFTKISIARLKPINLNLPYKTLVYVCVCSRSGWVGVRVVYFGMNIHNIDFAACDERLNLQTEQVGGVRDHYHYYQLVDSCTRCRVQTVDPEVT